MVSSCCKDFCAKNGLGEAAMDKILKICQRSMESRECPACLDSAM